MAPQIQKIVSLICFFGIVQSSTISPSITPSDDHDLTMLCPPGLKLVENNNGNNCVPSGDVITFDNIVCPNGVVGPNYYGTIECKEVPEISQGSWKTCPEGTYVRRNSNGLVCFTVIERPGAGGRRSRSPGAYGYGYDNHHHHQNHYYQQYPSYYPDWYDNWW